MSNANQYIPFATGSSPNTLTFAAYSGNSLVGTGHLPGVALSEVMNTTLRQVTVAVAAVAQLAADFGTHDVLDNGVVADFEVALLSALDALYVRDSDFTGSNQALSTNGYQKLPGGLILQWGTDTADHMASSSGGTTTPVTTTFPVAFPTACLNVSMTTRNPSNDQVSDTWPELVSSSATGFQMVPQSTGNAGTNYTMHGFLWFAIGK